jgi:ATP-dependent DNA helicase Q4
VLLFRNRLLDFDLFELRAEVARVNHILKENGFDWKLSTNGKKEDMIQALVSAITKLFPAEDVEVMGPELDIGRECLPQLTPSEGLSEGDIILDDSLSEISHVELSDAEEEAGPRRNTLVASSDMEQEDLVLQALRRSFALSSLKCGQEWAINRVLSNQRSLLILPTGAGKSLTFLLPSLLCCPRDGVTIVISPLVALMRDQMRKLPFNLPAACLSGEVTATEAAKICADLVAGYLRIIFISPERLCSPSFLRLIRSLRRSTRAPCQKLSDDLSAELTGPGVGLLCIDEAHCLSQWSFNFRPSFLRIKREIQRIQPKSVLALTATAPSHVQRDIQLSLGIPDDGVFFIPPHRPNLELASEFINGEDEKREMILQALKKNSESKKRQCPTIIYVWRRDEADTLSQFLQVEGIAAKGYHAGMSSSQRMRIQHLFYRGNLDVVGMLIHYPLF